MHQNYHKKVSLFFLEDIITEKVSSQIPVPHTILSQISFKTRTNILLTHAKQALPLVGLLSSLSLSLGEREEIMGVMRQLAVLLTVVVVIMTTITTISEGAIPTNILKKVLMVNKRGPFLGLVVPNSFEMSPLLQSSKFVQSKKLPYLDFGGRRFRFGKVGEQKVIIVMTGLSMLNAGITTQLLLTLFDVKGVVHFGIAGNANSDLEIGDVTIPKHWAHTGLWNWQVQCIFTE